MTVNERKAIKSLYKKYFSDNFLEGYMIPFSEGDWSSPPCVSGEVIWEWIEKKIIDELLAKIDDNKDVTRNDRDRPYDGQSHTSDGLGGKTKIKGITFRDLQDCFIKGCLLSCGDKQPELYRKVEENSWLINDIYKIDFGNIDPMAIIQNMSCEVEKMMGIYPNIPKLVYSYQIINKTKEIK